MELETKIGKYIEFTGDYSKLKGLGFTFQRLYAGNYMQWAHSTHKYGGATRIWRKGAEVTIDRLTNYEGWFLEAILKAKKEKATLKFFGHSIHYVYNPETKEIFFDEKSHKEAKAQRELKYKFYRENIDNDKEPPTETLLTDYFNLEDFKMVLELVDKGWAEVKTITYKG